MISNFVKIFSIVFLIFFNNEAKSNININKFDQRELSNYLSAIIALNNENNVESLKFFKSSKNLKDKHYEFFKKYISSLVLNQNVKSAIQEIKIQKNKKKTNFFEANLLLAIDSVQKKNFSKSKYYLDKISNYQSSGTFEAIIHESLSYYFYAFEKKKLLNQKSNFKNLDNLNLTLVKCFLGDESTSQSFELLINSSTVDYSRYLFFYVNHLIENKKLKSSKNIIDRIDEFNSTFLLLQTKIWLEQEKYENFNKIFSCNNENDILAEFFFLIANLYSTEGNYEKSNFYLSISDYLNKKFKYNLSLMADNYFKNKKYDQAKKVLNTFNDLDEIFYWYKIKKLTAIIYNNQNEVQAINYLENKYSKIDNKRNKIKFDMANIYKNYKKYDKAINLYSTILENLSSDDKIFGDILYRRGGSYERLGQFNKSDEDLILALKVIPDNSYILNYLAYSWLERNINISEAVEMLEIAYSKDENNPYITDSIGWAYYLTNRYREAEELIRKALIQMPNDPIVNDHYGDILWRLDKKLQAKFYWESVLKSKDADEDLKKKVKAKLLLGLS